MTTQPDRITDEATLRALYGAVNPRAVAKEIDRLDAHCLAFLALSPMLFMATSDGVRADVSPKGDAPGFVKADGERHVLIPDWPGNRRIDGLRNILKSPQVGLIFVIPTETWTLRINGTAEIRTDDALRARFETRGKLPITVLRVAVEEVFLHCAKAFMRAALWSPDTWPGTADRPAIGEMLKAHAALDQTPDRDDMDRVLAETLY
ncbi:MAG: PPOX class probable FMN-dependent enzyme [Paracoccaceae bacterium]|jgi:PPOX class probable FMN-dependent enzyme